MEKACKLCGFMFGRKRRPNGKRYAITTFNKQQYCSVRCARVAERTDTPVSNTSRRWAQKAFKAIECSSCKATDKLTRDHIDGNPHNNDPSNIQILCRRCHVRLEWQRGKYANRVAEIKRRRAAKA